MKKSNQPCPQLSIKLLNHTAQKKKFSIKDSFNNCDQIRRKQWIWSHLLKTSLITCAVLFYSLYCWLWMWFSEDLTLSPFSVWCPLKGQKYLSFICMCERLVDKVKWKLNVNASVIMQMGESQNWCLRIQSKPNFPENGHFFPQNICYAILDRCLCICHLKKKCG